MVFEEEDFQPVMYGYRLVPDVTDTRALGMLREVEDELGKKMKTLKSTILSQNPKDPRLLSQVYLPFRYKEIFFNVSYFSARGQLGSVLETEIHSYFLHGSVCHGKKGSDSRSRTLFEWLFRVACRPPKDDKSRNTTSAAF
jgi:hypothetical protein